MIVPANMLPIYRIQQAFEKGTHDKIMFTSWGGLGDQACAVPVLEYAIKTLLKDKREIYLATDFPELFQHLGFTKIFPYSKLTESGFASQFLILDTIVPATDILWSYVSHGLSHPVDFASICALRRQLPVKDKVINLPDFSIPESLNDVDWSKAVVVHAGKHWPSKTFPKDWWDDVLSELVMYGLTPILIGRDLDDNRGTVDVNPIKCLDLRGKTTLTEMIAILKKARVVLTNDSSPLHIAASGRAFIGFIASCKHPDFLYHWRNDNGVVSFGWRMENLGRDGIWNHTDEGPLNKGGDISTEFLPEGLMNKILPSANSVAKWALLRIRFK